MSLVVGRRGAEPGEGRSSTGDDLQTVRRVVNAGVSKLLRRWSRVGYLAIERKSGLDHGD